MTQLNNFPDGRQSAQFETLHLAVRELQASVNIPGHNVNIASYISGLKLRVKLLEPAFVGAALHISNGQARLASCTDPQLFCNAVALVAGAKNVYIVAGTSGVLANVAGTASELAYLSVQGVIGTIVSVPPQAAHVQCVGRWLANGKLAFTFNYPHIL